MFKLTFRLSKMKTLPSKLPTKSSSFKLEVISKTIFLTTNHFKNLIVT